MSFIESAVDRRGHKFAEPRRLGMRTRHGIGTCLVLISLSICSVACGGSASPSSSSASEPTTLAGGSAYGEDVSLGVSLKMSSTTTPVIALVTIESVGVDYSSPFGGELNAPQTSLSVTPVRVAVTRVFRNENDLDVSQGLVMRDFAGFSYDEGRLSEMPIGTTMIVFIQEPASRLSDGAQTAIGAFVVRDGVVFDRASGQEVSLAGISEYLANPDSIPAPMLER